ncbi:hypothetical protein C1881_06150 [Slackia isoflavoniconvertens]|uniref:Uncharacterized protein n=1 Tax=Slackia isoflavoniconvertens TaxID=572010 RepID=A0A369LFS2_9ACTN|nr:hypothetical protein C1881_06150 [Slackia isoflavoniconvertens]
MRFCRIHTLYELLLTAIGKENEDRRPTKEFGTTSNDRTANRPPKAFAGVGNEHRWTKLRIV